MYTPKVLNAASIESLAISVQTELTRLAIEFAQPSDYLALKTLHEAPNKTLEGMIVKADGTNWNPGSGAGVYAYVGSAWVKL